MKSHCSRCGDNTPENFYPSNQSTCKGCCRQRVQEYKSVRRESRKQIADAKAPSESIPTIPCAVCGVACAGGPGLLIHLQEAHRLPDGRVLCLNVVPCLICGDVRKGQLYTHLQTKHQTSATVYINQFPWGLLYPYEERRLARGDVRRHLPDQRARKPRSDKNAVSPPKERKRNFVVCPICLKETPSLGAHVARQHPTFSNVPLFDDFPSVTTDSEGDVEKRIGLALSLRVPVDVERSWPMGEERVYFIQTGGPRGPIKIGWSADTKARIETLQVMSPSELRVLTTIRGGAPEEQTLHRIFAPFGLRGEWFRPHPILLGYIIEANRTARGEQPEYAVPEGDDEAPLLEKYQPRTEGERFAAIVQHIEAVIGGATGFVSAEILLATIHDRFGPGPETKDWVDMWINRMRGARYTFTKKARVTVGQIYGQLTVTAFAGRVRASEHSASLVRAWLCRCSCGQEATVSTHALRAGSKRSCGCLAPQQLKQYQFKPRLKTVEPPALTETDDPSESTKR